MATAKNVFAGLKLSEQARPQPGGIDQRLFSSPTPPPRPPQDEPVTTTAAPTVPAPAPAPPPVSLRTAAEPVPASFDLTDLPYRKDTFLFTPAEFEALEDLKLHVRRALDTKVTKNDLARCAIRYLVESVQDQGTDSPVIAPLRRRKA